MEFDLGVNKSLFSDVVWGFTRLYTCKYPEINEQLYLHLKKELQVFASFLSSASLSVRSDFSKLCLIILKKLDLTVILIKMLFVVALWADETDKTIDQ